MSSPTPTKRIFIRHAQAASLPRAKESAENQHLTLRGIEQAVSVGRGEIGALARAPGTRIFCSPYDRAIETLICLIDPDGGPSTIGELRQAVKGRRATRISYSDERFINLGVALPPILENVTFDRRLLDRVPPEALALRENLLVVGHREAGCALFNGRVPRNAEGWPF